MKRTMSSREIAELTGKRHDNVVADIRKMLSDLGLMPPDFSGDIKVPMPKGGFRHETVFNLPERETMILVSGYDTVLRARVVDRWQALERRAAVQQLPPYFKRYLLNNDVVPPGYFSALQEAVNQLVGPLHNIGFDIPNNWVPDISIGMGLCAFLRNSHGINTDGLPTYHHTYVDGRVVNAKLYPERFLPIFREWFRDNWLPTNGRKYFKSKDPRALEFLNRIPALTYNKTA